MFCVLIRFRFAFVVDFVFRFSLFYYGFSFGYIFCVRVWKEWFLWLFCVGRYRVRDEDLGFVFVWLGVSAFLGWVVSIMLGLYGCFGFGWGIRGS